MFPYELISFLLCSCMYSFFLVYQIQLFQGLTDLVGDLSFLLLSLIFLVVQRHEPSTAVAPSTDVPPGLASVARS